MAEAVIFIGVQASGKSSFYRERFFRTHVRVNLDMLKTRHREKCLLEVCLATGQRYVVDNTNPTRETRAPYIRQARDNGFAVIGYYFQSQLAACSARNTARDVHQFEAPFDPRFRDMIAATVVHLLDCGFQVSYGYTQSDEISLLFALAENSFGRKLRKLHSVLAGEARAKFSTLLGAVGAFDCRICQLPSADLVVDYFRWRNEDAHRNALNAHCYWSLRQQGESPQGATRRLAKLPVAAKNELLFQTGGINFNDLPLWQRRGIGVYWESYQKPASNPQVDTSTLANRRLRIKVDMELPMRDAYSEFVRLFIQ